MSPKPPKPQAPEKLLSREAFKEACFARDKSRCLLCPNPAKDAHHILDRKLFADGGYYLSNGASLCPSCHMKAETCQASVETIRAAGKISASALPPGFKLEAIYDKWGNREIAPGRFEKGPLFDDPGAKKALAMGARLRLFL